MKFKVGDIVRPKREHIINAIENNTIDHLEYINGFQAFRYARKLKPQLKRKEIAEKFGVSEDFTLVE